MATRASWAKHVTAWKAGDLSARQYAARHGLSMSSLKWWAAKLKREQPGFVRVVTDAPRERRGGTLTIELGGARIVVGEDVDAGLLTTVVRALREAAT